MTQTTITYGSNFVFLGTNRLPHCDPYISSLGGFIGSYESDVNGNIAFDVDLDAGGVNKDVLFENNKILLYGEHPYYNESAEYVIQTVTNGNRWCRVTAVPTDPNKLILSPYHSDDFSISQSCNILENYYTNEVLRIRLYTTYVQSGPMNSLKNFSRIKVFGTPLLKLRFFTNNGTMIKYARYNEKYSTGDYFEFHYVIESTDIGQFAIGAPHVPTSFLPSPLDYPIEDLDIFAYTEESEIDYLYVNYEDPDGSYHEFKYRASQWVSEYIEFSGPGPWYNLNLGGETKINGHLINYYNDGSATATERVRINTDIVNPLNVGQQFRILLKRSNWVKSYCRFFS